VLAIPSMIPPHVTAALNRQLNQIMRIAKTPTVKIRKLCREAKWQTKKQLIQ